MLSKEELSNNAIQTTRSKDKPNHRQRKEHSTTTVINCVDGKDMEKPENPSAGASVCLHSRRKIWTSTDEQSVETSTLQHLSDRMPVFVN